MPVNNRSYRRLDQLREVRRGWLNVHLPTENRIWSRRMDGGSVSHKFKSNLVVVDDDYCFTQYSDRAYRTYSGE
jgi:hypothetical protein